MAGPSFLSALASVNPALSACLREAADFLAAPGATRLSEQQRALTLGVARRLIADVAALLGPAVDAEALWQDWGSAGLPGAERLAGVCFARAEEHRWRDQAQAQGGDGPAPLFDIPTDPGEAPALPRADDPLAAVDTSYLALNIADRRRFDALGRPSIAIDDLDADLLRALLLDIAAWQLLRSGKQADEAARLGEAVRSALVRPNPGRGIDAAAEGYHAAIVTAGSVAESTTAAIARNDWLALIALAAAALKYRYDDMAVALITAEPAQLAPLLTPLIQDGPSLAPLEGSLAMLTNRAIASAAVDDYAAVLQARAAMLDGGQ